MIGQKIQLQTQVGGRDHTYQCDPTCPLTDVLDALNVFRSYIYGRIKETEEQNSQSEKDKGNNGKEEAPQDGTNCESGQPCSS